MEKSQLKRNLVLGILFFLPVMFLLLLYPAKHNYIPLDIINPDVKELSNVVDLDGNPVSLTNNITVIGFLGNNPLANKVEASNAKELIYDKFKGFKRFQLVMLVPKGNEAKVEELKKEISNYEDLKYWHFAFAEPEEITQFFSSLKSDKSLDGSLGTNEVFIIDKELNQRGRIDDRTDNEIKQNKPIYGLASYNCIEVAELKNKMSEDVRILFTEYRQKRKGNFDSSTRREQNLKTNEQEN